MNDSAFMGEGLSLFQFKSSETINIADSWQNGLDATSAHHKDSSYIGQ
jgi:hypothetical protein